MGKIDFFTLITMKMIIIKQLILVTIVILFLCGCNPRSILGYPVHFDENQIYFKYDNLRGGVEKLINTNGYYSCRAIRHLSWFPNAPFYSDGPESASLIFFNDGSFSWLEWKEQPPLFLGFDNLNLSEHLKLEYPDSPVAGTVKDWSKKYELCGGTYDIFGDTIIVEQTSVDYYSRDLKRTGFVVIDRNTIRMIFHEDVNKEPKYYLKNEFDNKYESDFLFHFHPAINLPTSINTYDKHQKCRWNDEEKWKAYDRQRMEYMMEKRHKTK